LFEGDEVLMDSRIPLSSSEYTQALAIVKSIGATSACGVEAWFAALLLTRSTPGFVSGWSKRSHQNTHAVDEISTI